MIKKMRLALAVGVMSLGSLLVVGGSAFAATTGDSSSNVGTSVKAAGDVVSATFPTAQTIALGGPGTDKIASVMGAGTGTESSDNLITLDDATGTGDGWTATIQSTPLTEVTPSDGFATGTSPITLPAGTVNFDSASDLYGMQDQGAADDPTFNVYSTPQPIDDGSAVEFASADAGQGAGEWGAQWSTTSSVLEFILPATAKITDPINYPGVATPYSATVTVTMTENPPADSQQAGGNEA